MKRLLLGLSVCVPSCGDDGASAAAAPASVVTPSPAPPAEDEPTADPTDRPRRKTTVEPSAIEGGDPVVTVMGGRLTPELPVGTSAAGTYDADLGGGVTLRMAAVGAGTFKIGTDPGEPDRDADERAYQAVLSAYWIGTTEVTQAQWRAVMGDAPSECSVGCGDDYPVNKITWEDAARFANTLSRKLGFSECYQHVYSEWVWDRSCDGFRFPTEAEWETAARAGTTTPYSFGDRSVVCVHANLNEDTEPDCSDGYEGLAPVQTYGPNAWGVYGMHGNAREWIWDFDGDYPTGVVHDPAGPTSGNYRGLRGGSFENSPEFLRSAFRDSISPTIGTESIGFRVARSGRSR